VSAIAAALHGCDATLSGWHVVRVSRRDLLRPGGVGVVRWMELLGVKVEYVDRYAWNERPEKPTCLCGWHPTEAALIALQEQYEAITAGPRADLITPHIERV